MSEDKKDLFESYGKVMALLEKIDVDKLAALLNAVEVRDGRVILDLRVILN